MHRTLPPVRSPLTLRAIAHGLRATYSESAAADAYASVHASLCSNLGDVALMLTDSGTSALAHAIRAAACLRTGPVAIPAYACYDVASAVVASGVPFELYDVDPATLAPDVSSLQSSDGNLSMVLVAHLYGIPIDPLPVRSAIGDDAFLIDDAAQGVSAFLDGHSLGTLGDVGILSFGRGKGMTGGGGGAIVVPRGSRLEGAIPELSQAKGGIFRDVVKSGAQWALARPRWYALPLALPFLGLGETVFRRSQPATSMSPFSLGVLADTAPLAAKEASLRRQHAGFYQRALREYGLISPKPASSSEPGWLRFPVVVPQGAVGALRQIGRRLGILPGYPTSLADLPGFGERRKNVRSEFPGARALAARLFTLPTHGALKPRDLEAVVSCLRESLRG